MADSNQQSPWPNPIGGTHKLVAWLEKLRRRSRESEITSVQGGFFKQNGENGRALIIQLPLIKGGTAGMVFKGEWSANAATKGIKPQDVYKVSAGDTAGTYVCVKDNPGVDNPPDLNNGFWTDIGKGDTIGVWL